MEQVKALSIEVEGSELELITITLTDTEVASLYKTNKLNLAKIAELEKQLASEKSSHGYATSKADRLEKELNQSNLILTALNVPQESEALDCYDKKLNLPARLAFLIKDLLTKG